MLKTPKFWTRKNLLSFLLLPFSAVYFFVFLLVGFFRKSHKISKPVICVGNLIAGGSGKTPTAIALGEILKEMSVNFAYLSRGYMGDSAKFLMLKKADYNKADQVGDEPLLLLETAATFVAKDRLFGAREIDNMNKFQAIISDDGMQNNSLHRDYTIMVVDGKIGFGNGFLIPAGPMREPLCSGLKKADLVVVIGEVEKKLLQKLSAKKVVKAYIATKNLENFYGKKLIAFCGLAYPQKFFDFLKENGLQVIETVGFPDHYFYNDDDLKKLFELAQKENATLVTTKKDWIKFSYFYQEKIDFLDISLKFEDKELVKSELRKIL